MTDGRTTVADMRNVEPSEYAPMLDTAYDALDVVTAVGDFLLVLEGRSDAIHEKSYGTYSNMLYMARDTLGQVLDNLKQNK